MCILKIYGTTYKFYQDSVLVSAYSFGILALDYHGNQQSTDYICNIEKTFLWKVKHALLLVFIMTHLLKILMVIFQ